MIPKSLNDLFINLKSSLIKFIILLLLLIKLKYWASSLISLELLNSKEKNKNFGIIELLKIWDKHL